MPNRLLRRRWGKQDTGMPLSAAREIVAAYRELLGGCDALRDVHDAGELPYPKDEIKRALRTVLAGPGPRRFRPSLRDAYLQLARWQEGYLRGADAGARTDGSARGEMAGSPPAGASSDEQWEALWQARVAAERAALRTDLERL